MRQKTVFTDISEIAHLWANQHQDSARNPSDNFYFNGSVIYSYGSHFPIAQICTNPKTLEKVCLFTTQTYSNTTSKHISIVSRANHLPVILMKDLPGTSFIERKFVKSLTANSTPYGVGDFHMNNLKQWDYELEACYTKLATARKKEIYIEKINTIISEIRAYIGFFGISENRYIKTLLTERDAEKNKQIILARAAKIKADKAKQAKKATKEFNENLAKWRNYEIGDLYKNYALQSQFPYDYLRLIRDGENVQTSQNVLIPIDVARAFYHHVTRVISLGGCKGGNCGKKFMHQYEVKEINPTYLHIGCHKIEIDEIETFAASQGWK